MFGLGTWEILLILVAALVFIGPDKLPKVAKTIGKGMRQVRSAMSDVDHQVRQAGRDFIDQATADEREAEADLTDGLADRAGPAEPDGAEGAATVEVDEADADGVDAPPSPKQDATDWYARVKRPVEGRVASPPPTRKRAAASPGEPPGPPEEGEAS